jgi:predicted nuclease of predicted toxin-antitoxin system
MRLLFDEQLSPRLASALQGECPGSQHVHDAGLGSADDRAVFAHARLHGFLVVTKDSDFADLAVSLGSPPKVVWLRLGNGSTSQVLEVLRSQLHSIREFAADPGSAVLALVRDSV